MEQCSFGRFCLLGGTIRAGQASTYVQDRIAHMSCANEAKRRYSQALRDMDLDIPLSFRHEVMALMGLIDRAITNLSVSSTGTLLLDTKADPNLN